MFKTNAGLEVMSGCSFAAENCYLRMWSHSYYKFLMEKVDLV